MIEVYYWEAISGNGKQKESVGHSSMLISFDDDEGCYAAYVSWWPKGDIWGSPSFTDRAFSNDVADENRKPTKTYRFTNILNERKALDFWNEWKKNVQYKLWSRNCSTTVLEILKAAGIKDYVTIFDPDPIDPSFVSSVCYSVYQKLTRYPKLYMKPGMAVSVY